MHDVTIREATLEDVPGIAALAGELGYPTAVPEMRLRVRALLSATPLECVLVAARPLEVVGWIQVSAVTTLESGSYAEIRGLIVGEAYRNARIGELLVQAAEEWAESQALTRMRVRTNILRERTHRFYERLGYVSSKTQKIYDKVLER